MKILYVASEANPYAASGGLGDVMGALPITVAENNPDVEVSVIMPLYGSMKMEHRALLEKVTVRAISHITGGGFYENIPRSLPDGLGAKIYRKDLRILPIFDLIAKVGNIPERDMFNTFNMGVGMSVIVKKEDAALALEILKANGEDAYICGEIIESEEGVVLV